VVRFDVVEQRQCRPGDREVALLAARQHGVVAHGQLTALGISPGAIRYRLENGRLHRLHVGVYAVGHPAITTRGTWLAAVLACGPAAALSHRSAAALWQLPVPVREQVDVTVSRNGRARPGIALHHVRHLHRDDRTARHAIPVTAVARTLFDLAEILHRRDLARVFEEALRLRLVDLRALELVYRRARGRRGLRPFGDLIAEERPPPPETRSDLERRFLALCRDAALPQPEVNVELAGLEVDVLWRGPRLVVELDGHAFHHTRAAFERDRMRDATLQLNGYRVLRVTHRRLEAHPAQVTTIIRSLLSA
jgi:very-short-patch-repair endonuclease